MHPFQQCTDDNLDALVSEFDTSQDEEAKRAKDEIMDCPIDDEAEEGATDTTVTVNMDAASDPGMGRPTADCCVTDVKPGGQAARAGIKAGWKMVAVNGVAISSLMDFGREMNAAKQKGTGQKRIMVDLAFERSAESEPEEPFTPHDDMRPGWDDPLDHIAGE